MPLTSKKKDLQQTSTGFSGGTAFSGESSPSTNASTPKTNKSSGSKKKEKEEVIKDKMPILPNGNSELLGLTQGSFVETLESIPLLKNQSLSSIAEMIPRGEILYVFERPQIMNNVDSKEIEHHGSRYARVIVGSSGKKGYITMWYLSNNGTRSSLKVTDDKKMKKFMEGRFADAIKNFDTIKDGSFCKMILPAQVRLEPNSTGPVIYELKYHDEVQVVKIIHDEALIRLPYSYKISGYISLKNSKGTPKLTKMKDEETEEHSHISNFVKFSTNGQAIKINDKSVPSTKIIHMDGTTPKLAELKSKDKCVLRRFIGDDAIEIMHDDNVSYATLSDIDTGKFCFKQDDDPKVFEQMLKLSDARKLFVACITGQTDVVKKILEEGKCDCGLENCRHGHIVNSQDTKCRTPLMYAVAFGHQKIVEMILEHSESNIFIKDEFGNQALHYIARYNPTKNITELLLDVGAAPSHKNHAGITPIDAVIMLGLGKVDIVKLLIRQTDKSFLKHQKCSRKWSPLDYADSAREPEMIEYLEEIGAPRFRGSFDTASKKEIKKSLEIEPIWPRCWNIEQNLSMDLTPGDIINLSEIYRNASSDDIDLIKVMHGVCDSAGIDVDSNGRHGDFKEKDRARQRLDDLQKAGMPDGDLPEYYETLHRYCDAGARSSEVVQYTNSYNNKSNKPAKFDYLEETRGAPNRSSARTNSTIYDARGSLIGNFYTRPFDDDDPSSWAGRGKSVFGAPRTTLKAKPVIKEEFGAPRTTLKAKPVIKEEPKEYESDEEIDESPRSSPKSVYFGMAGGKDEDEDDEEDDSPQSTGSPISHKSVIFKRQNTASREVSPMGRDSENGKKSVIESESPKKSVIQSESPKKSVAVRKSMLRDMKNSIKRTFSAASHPEKEADELPKEPIPELPKEPVVDQIALDAMANVSQLQSRVKDSYNGYLKDSSMIDDFEKAIKEWNVSLCNAQTIASLQKKVPREEDKNLGEFISKGTVERSDLVLLPILFKLWSSWPNLVEKNIQEKGHAQFSRSEKRDKSKHQLDVIAGKSPFDIDTYQSILKDYENVLLQIHEGDTGKVQPLIKTERIRMENLKQHGEGERRKCKVALDDIIKNSEQYDSDEFERIITLAESYGIETTHARSVQAQLPARTEAKNYLEQANLTAIGASFGGFNTMLEQLKNSGGSAYDVRYFTASLSAAQKSQEKIKSKAELEKAKNVSELRVAIKKCIDNDFFSAEYMEKYNKHLTHMQKPELASIAIKEQLVKKNKKEIRVDCLRLNVKALEAAGTGGPELQEAKKMIASLGAEFDAREGMIEARDNDPLTCKQYLNNFEGAIKAAQKVLGAAEVKEFQDRLAIERALLPAREQIRRAINDTDGYAYIQDINELEAMKKIVKQVEKTAAEAKIPDQELLNLIIHRRRIHNHIEGMKGKIRIFCRIRPLLDDAMDNVAVKTIDECTVRIDLEESGGSRKKDESIKFEFNTCYDNDAGQAEIFSDVADVVQSCVDGYNCAIFAYGQTGSGKTHTMFGSKEQPGVVPRTAGYLFKLIEEQSHMYEFDVGGSLFEVYNGKIIDQLAKTNTKADLDVGWDEKHKRVLIEGLTEEHLKNAQNFNDIVEKGMESRHVSATNMNSQSSRSHEILQIVVRATRKGSKESRMGKIVLIDLAGSERLKKSGVSAEGALEAVEINKSLTALGDVIQAAGEGQKNIPYRNHVLTKVMRDAIGGTAKTLMFVNVSPSHKSTDETMQTLKWAERARMMKDEKAPKSSSEKDKKEKKEKKEKKSKK